MKRLIDTARMLLISVIFLMTASGVYAKTVGLSHIHCIKHYNDVQLTLNFDQDFSYKSFTLRHPDRFVLDFNNTHLHTKLPKIDLNHTTLKKIRYATHQNKFRLVFDVDGRPQVRLTRSTGSTGKHQLTINVQDHLQQLSPTRSSAPTKAYRHDTTQAEPKTLSERVAQISQQLAQPSEPIKKAKNVTTRLAKLKTTVTNTIKRATTPKPQMQRLPVEAVLQPIQPPRPAMRDIIVVIDPGHGGKDPGAEGIDGIKEKNVVLAIARKLQAMINAEPGFKAILTRNTDRYLALRQRMNFAHQYHADMFVAIHADAYRHDRAHGVSVYALSERGATSEAARWLAARENESEFVGGLDLGDRDYLVRSVLIDLSQTHVISVSLQMGTAILSELGKFADLHHNTVEQAAFVVLKSPDIPSLLVESGFLSNPKEASNLTQPEYQNRIAMSIKHGIKSYFVSHPPRGTQLASRYNNRHHT